MTFHELTAQGDLLLAEYSQRAGQIIARTQRGLAILNAAPWYDIQRADRLMDRHDRLMQLAHRKLEAWHQRCDAWLAHH